MRSPTNGSAEPERARVLAGKFDAIVRLLARVSGNSPMARSDQLVNDTCDDLFGTVGSMVRNDLGNVIGWEIVDPPMALAVSLNRGPFQFSLFHLFLRRSRKGLRG